MKEEQAERRRIAKEKLEQQDKVDQFLKHWEVLPEREKIKVLTYAKMDLDWEPSNANRVELAAMYATCNRFLQHKISELVRQRRAREANEKAIKANKPSPGDGLSSTPQVQRRRLKKFSNLSEKQ